ncbi:MAG: ABC transporter substrate-binding protein [Bacteroidota bacterium]
MKSVSGVLKGIVALLVVAAILLLSDLNNRTGSRDKNSKSSAHKVFKMSLIHFVDSPNSEDCEKGTRDYLAEIGWTEGKDFTLNVYNAQGDMSALNSITGTVTSQEWDMIIANSTPTIQALARKGSKCPIVFTNVGDPIIAGLGSSFEDHVAGITGISTMSDFEGMVDLILTLQPGIRRIGTVFSPAEINSVAYKEGLEKAAKKKGIELVCAAASSATEVTDAAVSLTSKRIGAFCQISDNLTASCISAIIKAADNARLPMYGFVTKLIGQGVMAVVARDYHQAGYDAGVMVKKILGGTPAGEIPFQLVTKTVFEINTTIAAKYKIVIPEGLSEKIKLIN